MNTDPDSVLEDEFTAHLLAYEEALVGGAPADVGEDTSPEMQTRLLRGLACVQRLQQLRPRQSLPLDAKADDACPARIGRFEIRCLLGRGGFGIVYRAYDPVLKREVALKIPRADVLVDADCLARFQREALAAAGLDHANLVPVYEAGQIGPICYIAFAYCPGNDLATWLKQRTAPVRCVEAARLVRILARAIHCAHGCGILHRDLKPSNVLLSPAAHAATGAPDNVWLPTPDSPLIPRVADFGLAKFSAGDQTQTQTGNLLGTPSYMAPEQTEGKQVGPSTDVYALAVILYELLTGRPPFWADTALATMLQVKTAEPVPPSRLRPDLPRDLETICLKCLHKEPRKRYASAEALADDLDRFLSGMPILARSIGRGEKALKLARRHPALAASLGALLLVTALGTAGILGQWQKTQGALADAVTQTAKAQKAHKRSELTLYHHRVVLAHHEWQNGNVGRSAQLLSECPTELRNWEWRYVRRLCDSAVFTCGEHSSQVLSVAFSPDGRYFVSGAGQWFSTKPGEVKLWDAATGKLLWTGRGHTGSVMSVAFSPDGRRVAAATGPWGTKAGEVIIWETATGKALTTLSDMPPGVFGVAFHPDGDRLATAGSDCRIRLWDLESGRRLFELAGRDGHQDNVFSVAFSPDGTQLASAGRDGAAILWDLASRRAVQCLHGPIDLRSVAFSRDGQRLVAASFDHSVKIWDVSSGQLLLTNWGHRGPVLCATFAPDGQHVASTDSLGRVHVWDAETGRIFRTVHGHTGGVFWAAFSPDGRRLATAGKDGTVRLWDITHEQATQSLPHGPEGAQSVVFGPKDRVLAASGYLYSDGTMEKRIRVWDMDDPTRPRFWEGHTGSVRCVGFSADGKFLASGSSDKTVRLWDVAAGRSLRELRRHTDMVTGVAFHPDGTRLASASLDKTVQVWDLSAAEPVPIALPHPFPVHHVAFAPDGKRLVAVGGNGMVLVWDAATLKQLYSLPDHSNVVGCAVFSPNGDRLATAGDDRMIRIWDMTTDPADGQTAKPLHTLEGHTDRITGLCFSSDGCRLASTGSDQTIRIWDAASGNESLTLRGHPGSTRGVAFSPDGRFLVSSSTRDIKIWDAGDTPATPADTTSTNVAK